MTNQEIAKKLRQHAAELDHHSGNLFRRRAFRAAADAVDRLLKPAATVIAEEGRRALEELPGIGKSLAYTIEMLATTGELKTLDPADILPNRRLMSLPGVGAVLAEQLQERLGITTIDELAEAVKEERLADVGVGPKRLAALRAVLEMRQKREDNPEIPEDEPGIETLLAADAEYRRAMDEQSLPLRAPFANNPDAQRWLGILRVNRDGWRMRVMFSNTAVAHRAGKTHDWVVIYFERESGEGQRTVVTETRGDLEGQRVVRGRESECRQHYQVRKPAA